MSHCTIIAGPCSVDDNNIQEIHEISQMTVINQNGTQQRAIAGTRIVGLKSRTELSVNGKGMGMDYDVLQQNVHIMINGGSGKDMVVTPSARIAEEIHAKTGMLIATEIMMPSVQMPSYEHRIPAGKLMPWNPSVNQLGWQVMETALFTARNGWHIGIKNGKWIGEDTGTTTMEKTWAGLSSYAKKGTGDVVLIHRGVDVPGKGMFRNLPVHTVAGRTKKITRAKLYFDPSHSYGPKLKHQIVEATVAAMNMKLDDGSNLYDGVLVEVGTSKTDTEQHITLLELEHMVKQIAKTRSLVTPEASGMKLRNSRDYIPSGVL